MKNFRSSHAADWSLGWRWGIQLLVPLALLIIFLQGKDAARGVHNLKAAFAQESDHGHSHAEISVEEEAASSTPGAVHVALRTQAALGITTRPAEKEDLSVTLDLNGTIRPRPQDIHDVHSPVEGIVLELHAFPGDQVEVGSPLITLQAPKILDWQEVLLQCHVETLDQASALSLLQAEGEAKMIEFLGDLQAKAAETQHFQEELNILQSAGTGAVSRQEIHHKEGEVKTSRAQLLAKRALAIAYGLDEDQVAGFESDLTMPENPDGLIPPEYLNLLREKRLALETRRVQAETARANLRSVGFPEEKLERLQAGDFEALTDRLVFHSVSAGVVTESEVSLQQAVTPVDHLFRIIDFSTVFIDAEIPEKDISQAFSRIEAPMPVRSLGLGGDILQATSVYLDSRVDRDRRTARLVASIENLPGWPLRDGMGVTLGMVVGSAENALTVPAPAVLSQGLESIVFVRDPKFAEDFLRRVVRTGLSNLEKTEIVSGLNEGEEVVVEGAFQLLLALQQAEGEGKEMDHGHAHH